MNHYYLMEHISYHLHTIVRHYSSEGDLIKSCCARMNFPDLFTDQEILDLFASSDGLPEDPVLLAVNETFVYAFVPCRERSFVIGPVRLTETISFLRSTSRHLRDSGWKDSVAVCTFHTLIQDVLLVCNLYRTDVYPENDLILNNCIHPGTYEHLHEGFSQLVFENRETGKTHNPYDQELREFASIETGNLEQLKRSLAEDYLGEVGTLAKTPLRHTKNRAIVVVTLASRAAIRGGIPSEIAFSLSDTYIQKIEECNDIPTLFHLFHAAEFEYARMVKELNAQKEGTLEKDKNPHINKCKDYIFSHLHDKITVQEIADALGLNANYLSGLFRQCEKISLTGFIRREKINLTKNLLTYSRYSYGEIAAYLGFSSQSHLGKYFREATGMTMRQYRDAYGVKEFDF